MVPLSQSRFGPTMCETGACCGKADPFRFMPSAIVAKPFRVLSGSSSVPKFNKGRTIPTPEEEGLKNLSPLLRDSRLLFVKSKRTFFPS